MEVESKADVMAIALGVVLMRAMLENAQVGPILLFAATATVLVGRKLRRRAAASDTAHRTRCFARYRRNLTRHAPAPRRRRGIANTLPHAA